MIGKGTDMGNELTAGHGFKFRHQLAQELSKRLQRSADILAAWEGGSSANSTSDQFSDIDLNILYVGNEDLVFQMVEATLKDFSEITHIYNEPKSLWPDLTQKVYFIKDSPKHFFVDVATFPDSKLAILEEFMQMERHGKPVILFDKVDRIKSHPLDREAFLKRQQRRLNEVEAFPVYRTTVFKELDRGNSIDAFAFYYSGMLRPLIEVIGMIYRPYRFDFGFRHLKRCLPSDLYHRIEPYFFVGDLNQLQDNATSVDKLFTQMVVEAKLKLSQNPT
jgi:hypothetical protein